MRSATAGSLKTVWSLKGAIVYSVDFVLGCLAFLVALTAALARSDLVARTGTEVAVAAGAVGIAIVGVALTALAILTALMTSSFAQALERAPGGIRGALMPYQIVASLAGLTVLLSLAAVSLGPALPRPLLILGFATLAGVAVWTLVGTMQLVGITVKIGLSRGKWELHLAKAERVLQERRAAERGQRDTPSSRG